MSYPLDAKTTGSVCRRRVLLSIAVGLLAGVITIFLPHPIHYQGVPVGDIGAPLIGFSRFLKQGTPFDLSTDFGPLAAYPFTTSVVLAPLLLIPLSWVAPCFCAISSGLLAYALLREGELWRLLAMVSMPYFSALHSVQWSPLFAASILLPALLPLAVVKPQLGLVVMAVGKWTWRLVAVTISIVILSLLIYPSWPLDWMRYGGVISYAGKMPLMVGPGVLLLLAGLFWRDAGARLLLTMALIPQRIWYDQLLLFLIPSTRHSLLSLVALSWVTAALTPDWGLLLAQGAQDPHAWLAVVCCLYLPTLGVLAWEKKGQISHLLRR